MKRFNMEYTDKSTRARRKKNKVKSRCVMIIIMSVTLLLGGFIYYVFSQKGEVAAMKKVPFDTYDNKTEKVPVIVLDAGHGGDDPGAMWGDICEKDINLQIAQKTEQILRKSGYQVKMTRWDDTKVSLAERVDIAEKEKADVFVSIHQNSMEDDEISDGIETYCNETKNKESFPLALSIQNNITEITKAKNRKVDKESDLHVVSKNKMASCLVETGFLSSTSERKLLLDEKYQKKLAQGIAQGIMQYLGNANIEAKDVSEQSKQLDSKETINNEPSPKEKVVYITIDDGPTLRTLELLEILERYDAKVTFFVTAQFLQGEELKQMLQRIHEKGHAIGVHTYSHDYKSIYSSVKNYMADYKKMNDIILDSIGESSGIFRFPGGSNTGYNEKIRKKLFSEVKKQGLVYYDWNAFTGDVDGLSKSKMLSKTLEESTYNNKTILLMHDVPDKKDVVTILPKILSKLKEKGYVFKNLDKTVVPIQFVK